jgi:hypothetical protein
MIPSSMLAKLADRLDYILIILLAVTAVWVIAVAMVIFC